MVPARAVESEGFSTWGVGVAENFNDSDSGQTFYSPLVTVCVTNVRKRHTWQFKQLDASTKDDHGYSDRRQRTNLHTFTQGPFQISSAPWAHHATYTLWMQPFGACITEISICSFWLALSSLRDVGEPPCVLYFAQSFLQLWTLQGPSALEFNWVGVSEFSGKCCVPLV